MSISRHATSYLKNQVFIKTLKINGFRCYESVDLFFKRRINIFYGDNGSGKTSVLEAIYFLSTGKSFRSKRNKHLINHNNKSLSLFTEFSEDINTQNKSIGISLNTKNKKQIKLNLSNLKNQSETAHQLPVVSIDPDSYLFLDKPPQFRRSFLDWLVFHVKPNYLKTWTLTSRCQKQLNASYREKKTDQLDYWQDQYIHYGNQLNELRVETYELLSKKVILKVKTFIPELIDFNLMYFKGWSKEFTLEQLLTKESNKNLLYGSLLSGVHKMDIKCFVGNKPASEVLSRGQKKLISIIFYLCFIELINEVHCVNPILCIDDMDAELDTIKTNVLCDFIKHTNNQVFISTVAPEKINSIFKEVGLFHVKHIKDKREVDSVN